MKRKYVVLVTLGVCFILLISMLGTFLNRVNILGEMVAFYDATSVNYETIITRTGGMLSIPLEDLTKALIPIQGSIEKMQVGQEQAKRLQEFRDRAEWYNSTLSIFQLKRRIFLVGFLYPQIPERLGPILIR